MFSIFKRKKSMEQNNEINQGTNMECNSNKSGHDIESFLIGTGTDRYGRSYNQIINYNDKQLEFDHSFIQWVFPTENQSMFNALAPIVTHEQVEKLAEMGVVKENLHRMFMRMLLFYGIRLVSNMELEENKDDTIVIISRGRRASWVFNKSRVNEWLRDGNHNLLRISRILECLRLFKRKSDHELLSSIIYGLVEYRPEVKTWSCWVYWTSYMMYENLEANMGD